MTTVITPVNQLTSLTWIISLWAAPPPPALASSQSSVSFNFASLCRQFVFNGSRICHICHLNFRFGDVDLYDWGYDEQFVDHDNELWCISTIGVLQFDSFFLFDVISARLIWSWLPLPRNWYWIRLTILMIAQRLATSHALPWLHFYLFLIKQ